MTWVETALVTLLSAPVVAFVGGVGIGAVRRTLRLPRPAYLTLSFALLSMIGFKGGLALSATTAQAVAPAALATDPGILRAAGPRAH